MSSGERIPLTQAQKLAAELLTLLSPYCERLEIVGSIRRERETIGDIELLAVPRTTERYDMFGTAMGTEIDALDEQCRCLIGRGILSHRLDKNGRNAFGKRYKRLRCGDVGVDLFSCLPPAEWGVLSVIRTGSADFSHRLVTPVEQGGWMPRGMVCRDGCLWDLTTGAAFPTPREVDVFAAIGRGYIEPRDREGRL